MCNNNVTNANTNNNGKSVITVAKNLLNVKPNLTQDDNGISKSSIKTTFDLPTKDVNSFSHSHIHCNSSIVSPSVTSVDNIQIADTNLVSTAIATSTAITTITTPSVKKPPNKRSLQSFHLHHILDEPPPPMTPHINVVDDEEEVFSPGAPNLETNNETSCGGQPLKGIAVNVSICENRSSNIGHVPSEHNGAKTSSRVSASAMPEEEVEERLGEEPEGEDIDGSGMMEMDDVEDLKQRLWKTMEVQPLHHRRRSSVGTGQHLHHFN